MCPWIQNQQENCVVKLPKANVLKKETFFS